MKPSEYAKMYETETRFWWFVGKTLIAAQLARRWFPPECEGLDAGCGTGAALIRLGERGWWCGVDNSLEALKFCLRRGCRTLAGAAERLPFAAEAFDAAVALDLLEHLQADGQALAELYRVLRPGGRLILTVPAYGFLWGAHDQALGHYRRYSRLMLRRQLEDAGFVLLWESHFLGLLLPVMLVGKLMQKVAGDPDETISYDWPEWINRLFLSIVKMELRLLEKKRMPVGTTLAVVAEKPKAGKGSEKRGEGKRWPS